MLTQETPREKSRRSERPLIPCPARLEPALQTHRPELVKKPHRNKHLELLDGVVKHFEHRFPFSHLKRTPRGSRNSGSFLGLQNSQWPQTLLPPCGVCTWVGGWLRREAGVSETKSFVFHSGPESLGGKVASEHLASRAVGPQHEGPTCRGPWEALWAPRLAVHLALFAFL